MATSNIKGNIVYRLSLGNVTASTLNECFQKVFNALPNTEKVYIGEFFYDGLYVFIGSKYQSAYGGFICQKLVGTSIYVVSVVNNVITYSIK